MKCPFCGHTEDRVVDSRVGREGEFIRRRRECLKCRKRYTTYEHIENVVLHVVKRDDRREEFDRQKLRSAILKAVTKRPVSIQQVDEMVADIEARLHERPEKEIRSADIGRMVMERLEQLDQVAYVRFASVYRNFEDVSEFKRTVDQLSGLLKDQKAKPAPAKPRALSRSK
jgi:transcriptional repressor NrdR